MANDSETRLAAMAEQAPPSTKPETTEEKAARKGPYFNCTNEIRAMITNLPTADNKDAKPGLLDKWRTDPCDENDKLACSVRDAVIGVLTMLDAQIVAFRDLPRDPAEAPGKHYVGIAGDGNRVHFKSSTVPTEKSSNALAFKIVLGPFGTQGGANYCVDKGRKAADTCVFHRAGTARDLGARADYATAVNAS